MPPAKIKSIEPIEWMKWEIWKFNVSAFGAFENVIKIDAWEVHNVRRNLCEHKIKSVKNLKPKKKIQLFSFCVSVAYNNGMYTLYRKD